MPANIKIVHAHEFIRATPEGQLNLNETRTLFLDITLAYESLQNYNIIIDTRKANSVMSVFDLWYLASELNKFIKSFSQKIAILYAPENFNDVDFFTLCSNNRGFNVNAFTSYEETLEWLLNPI